MDARDTRFAPGFTPARQASHHDLMDKGDYAAAFEIINGMRADRGMSPISDFGSWKAAQIERKNNPFDRSINPSTPDEAW